MISTACIVIESPGMNTKSAGSNNTPGTSSTHSWLYATMIGKDTKKDASSGAARFHPTDLSAISKKMPEAMPVTNATMHASQVPTMSIANAKDSIITPKMRNNGG